MTAWLVAIDLQRIFADPASPWAAPDYARAAAGTERLLDEFAGRTVFTRFVAPTEPRGAWVPYYQDWPFALVPADDPLYELMPPFDAAVRAGARVETRERFGKWDAALAAAIGFGSGGEGGDVGGADELFLTGVATDCCVLSTALAAADAGIRVTVVADACAGSSPAAHRRALDAMSLYAPLITIA